MSLVPIRLRQQDGMLPQNDFEFINITIFNYLIPIIMGKNSNKNSTKEILETTVKVAGAIVTIGGAVINALGNKKK